MRTLRQRLAAVTLLAGLTTLGLGLAASPAIAAVDEYCLGVIGDDPNGSLEITTTPDDGSDVEPGSAIAIDASWDAADFEETDRFVVCATVDGAFDEDMSSQYKGLENEGEYSGAAATVPSDLAPGSDICLFGVVKGQFTDGDPSSLMVSEANCFRTAAVVEPKVETTTTTVPTVVDPVVEEAGAPSAPAVEAAPAPAEAPAPLPVLPRTGAGIGLLAGFGGISLALGGVARFLGRRRSAEG